MLTAVEVAQLELAVDFGLDEALVAEAAAEPVTVPVKTAVVEKVTPAAEQTCNATASAVWKSSLSHVCSKHVVVEVMKLWSLHKQVACVASQAPRSALAIQACAQAG